MPVTERFGDVVGVTAANGVWWWSSSGRVTTITNSGDVGFVGTSRKRNRGRASQARLNRRLRRAERRQTKEESGHLRMENSKKRKKKKKAKENKVKPETRRR
jgi:hypothetical protein